MKIKHCYGTEYETESKSLRSEFIHPAWIFLYDDFLWKTKVWDDVTQYKLVIKGL